MPRPTVRHDLRLETKRQKRIVAAIAMLELDLGGMAEQWRELPDRVRAEVLAHSPTLAAVVALARRFSDGH